MIDPKQIRIGNKLLYRRNDTVTEIITVNWVSEDSIGYKEEHEASYPHSVLRYSGIPITVEWLEKNGFPEDANTRDAGGDYTLTFERREGALRLISNCAIEECFIKEIKYVHEFQNLYYELMGEELTVEP